MNVNEVRIVCEGCHGMGQIHTGIVFFGTRVVETCAKCKGRGYLFAPKCGHCNGLGYHADLLRAIE